MNVRDEVGSGLLQELIRVDTVNPPGNETRAADVLRRYLASYDIPCELIAKVPERANVVAPAPWGTAARWRSSATPTPCSPTPTNGSAIHGQATSPRVRSGRGALDMTTR